MTDEIVKKLFPGIKKKSAETRKKNTKPTPEDSDHAKNISLEKKDYEWDEYLSTISFQMCPANNAFFERLAIELTTWARENDDALVIEEFIDMKGIDVGDFYRFLHKNTNLKKAFETARRIIGTRRERGGIKKNLSESLIRFTQPLYNPEWARREKEIASLRHLEDQVPTKIEVIMQSFEDPKKMEATD